MSVFVRSRRPLRLALLVPALAAAACLEDDPTPRPQPTFTRMRLTYMQTGGGAPPQTIEIERSTGAISGPLTVSQAGGTLTARFLNADGTDDQVLQRFQPEYETRVFLTTGSNVTFTSTGPNTLTATRNAAGTGTARVQLYDLGRRTEVLGANMTVNTP